MGQDSIGDRRQDNQTSSPVPIFFQVFLHWWQTGSTQISDIIIAMFGFGKERDSCAYTSVLYINLVLAKDVQG